MIEATAVVLPRKFTGRIARTLRLILVAGLSSAVLVACGGGAPTTDNPITSVTPPSTYNGPPPQTADIQSFKLNVWDNIQATNRCGSCHAQGGQGNGYFVRNDDINLAYEAANLVADLDLPSNSLLVSRMSSGHNCWLTDDQACADIMTTWIEGWAGEASGGGRQITLTAPNPVDPGDSRSYVNATVADFATYVHGPVLTTYCAGCHSSQSATAQQPYFAEADAAVAFEAAKPKMDINEPAASRFVLRLGDEFHNCWSSDCAADAAVMQQAIVDFANTIPITQIDPLLVNSKALRLIDGTIASGGNRYENAQIGLWEFKTGSGTTAFDTSGVEPAINLQLIGNVEWFGGWGIMINDGRAQGDTTSSKKLHDLIRATGEYSIEAWVVPNNVTQEMSRIVTYSAGDAARNFTLEQNLYDYDFRHRSDTTGLNGIPALSTPAAAEVLQATLQHVVATYGPVEGRKIYVNGNLVTQPDPVATGSMAAWQDTFAFVLGNEASGDGLWQGTLRLVAIHNRELTQAQIVQNFDVGVGEKFYMLFGIEDIINVPTAYILFEVAQLDSYSYLFTRPHFITLDISQQPQGIPIQGLRIGINGAEVDKSQSYANMDDMLDYLEFGELGQPLGSLGAVIPLERGPAGDEFFLTFDLLGTESYVRTDDPPLVIIESDLLPPAQRIGVRTFDEINATMSTVTDVSPQDPAVDTVFQSLRQSLPAIEDPATFLSSHQVAVAQLAIEYCNALIENRGATSAALYFPGFDFDATPLTAFGNRNALIRPLVDKVMGIGIQTQPDAVDVEGEIAYNIFDPLTLRPVNLIDRLIAGGTDTRSISKGACAAVLGSAVMLIQ
ncbi:MAG: LamG domain-containing protein [Proteobacteria bacterium]|nr:LamG domain-containing protein [Pseudomonadota bacterium]